MRKVRYLWMMLTVVASLAVLYCLFLFREYLVWFTAAFLILFLLLGLAKLRQEWNRPEVKDIGMHGTIVIYGRRIERIAPVRPEETIIQLEGRRPVYDADDYDTDEIEDTVVSAWEDDPHPRELESPKHDAGMGHIDLSPASPGVPDTQLDAHQSELVTALTWYNHGKRGAHTIAKAMNTTDYHATKLLKELKEAGKLDVEK